MTAPVPLYRRILGPRFEALPPPLKRLHDGRARADFRGRCDIAGGTSLLAALLARMMSLPAPGRDVAVGVEIACDGDCETWTRRFAAKPMRSRLSEREGRLVEAVGPVQFAFELDVEEDAIVWRAVRAHALGVPLPLSWFPRIAAREAVEAGRYTFDVRAELPFVGLIVHYRGWLE